MPLRVSGIRVPVEAGGQELLDLAQRRAGLAAGDVAAMEVVRRSLDRRYGGLRFVYTVDLRLREEPALGLKGPLLPGVERVREVPMGEVPAGAEPLRERPVIVGMGPAGLFAALLLARRGYRPRLMERGDPMNLRAQRIRDINRDGVLDPESNYLFGEGGAGTFSDGKLTSRSKDPRSRFVLDEFKTKSGVESVTWDYRPHLGSDRVRAVVGRLRQEILALGGEIRFRCRMEGLVHDAGVVKAVRTTQGEIPAPVVILAPGHSARDLIRALHSQGIPMERKPFQLGLRVEHPQPWVDAAVYGRHAGHPALGAADYRLVVRAGGTTVYSFCMCPGGEIIPAVSDLEHLNTNGMSWSHKATGFANSGLVTTIEPDGSGGSHALAGLELQEHYEAEAARFTGNRLAVPGQCLLDYLAGRLSADLPRSSCRTGTIPAPLRLVIPPAVDRLLRDAIRGMDRQMRGFLHPDALLVGPESRSSSPIRIVRNRETLSIPGFEGVYPVGEGAGYAGGIVSAAIDGLRAAEAVIKRYRPVPADAG